MAINPEAQYPGKITPSSADYPFGEARNITTPGDGTGTPWEAALVNDLFGFQQAILSEAGATPSGDPETASASQYLAGLKAILRDKITPATSVAQVEALSLPAGDQVILFDGTRSGLFAVKAGASPSDPRRAIYIPLANGNHAERQYRGTTTGGAAVLGWFNAAEDGIANDTAAVQACIDFCRANAINEVLFVGDVYLATLPSFRQEVTFLGDGVFSGPGAEGVRYCKRSAPAYRPEGVQSNGALMLASQRLRRVSVVGDSLSTPAPNALDATSSFWSYIQDKIRADNPNEEIEFFNRAIGGRVFGELDGTPVSGFPSWYTDTGVPWLDYVEADKPDLVIVSMGMNGGGNTNNIASIISIIQKIRAWEYRPDMVFTTTPLPTTDEAAAFSGQFATVAAQEDRELVSWAVRSVCAYYGVPVLDVNRTCLAIRDGRDPLLPIVKRDTSPALTSGAFVSDIEIRNGWSASVNVPNRAAYSPTGNLAIRLDSKSAEAFLTLTGANELRVNLYGRPGNPYRQITVGPVIPDAPHTLEISVKGSELVVRLDGEPLSDVHAPITFIHEGGRHFPAIGNFSAGYANGPLTAVNYFNYNVPKRFKPTAKNSEIWGVSVSPADTKLPDGGNGVNHPTSAGARLLYGATLAACNFGNRDGFHELKEVVTNTGSATLVVTPTIQSDLSGLPGPGAGVNVYKQCFVYARCRSTDGALYSSAWYRLVNHGNAKWYLSEPMLEITTNGAVLDHTLAVDVDTGELTLTNSITDPAAHRPRRGRQRP